MTVLSKIKHYLARTAYSIIKTIAPVRKGFVFCESFGGLQYSCNPKYITETILNYYPDDFKVIWSFLKPSSIINLDDRIIKVRRGTIKEFLYFTTSEFLISNIRLNDRNWGWKKRKGQKYIMTWHGSMALKRVEFDAKDQLPPTYLKKAIEDSKFVDLMLSDSEWCTSFMRSAFHFDGEILDKGLPRNDIFFHSESIVKISGSVRSYYGIDENDKILLYAPTFRSNKSIENYIFNWEAILFAAEKRWNSKFKILIRLHPNMIGSVDPSPMLTQTYCVDVTYYPDMQELLCASDVLVTDYSSSMFEFALTRRPCFIYAPDAKSYDRGFYFRLNELPFQISSDESMLARQITSFKDDIYANGLNRMFEGIFKYTQIPCSSLMVVEWMINANKIDKQ